MFADPRSNLETLQNLNSPFWIYVYTVKNFYKEHGYLPLSGSLPDMTSDTNTYTTLVNLFRQQAHTEAEKIHEHASRLLIEFEKVQITMSDTLTYCKDFSRLGSVTGSNLSDEFANGLQVENHIFLKRIICHFSLFLLKLLQSWSRILP